MIHLQGIPSNHAYITVTEPQKYPTSISGWTGNSLTPGVMLKVGEFINPFPPNQRPPNETMGNPLDRTSGALDRWKLWKDRFGEQLRHYNIYINIIITIITIIIMILIIIVIIIVTIVVITIISSGKHLQSQPPRSQDAAREEAISTVFKARMARWMIT